MVFNGSSVALFIICVLILWLAGISVVLYKVKQHYNALTKGVTKAYLKEVLDKILHDQKSNEERFIGLSEALTKLTNQSGYHIQKIGIVRFNPFDDTGGSQSFTMALLNSHDTGIVITSLHARSGNRWYIKEISHGKGVNVELSREEQEVIKKAGKK